MKCVWNKCPDDALPEQTAAPTPDGKNTRLEWLCAAHRETVRVGMEMIAHLDTAMEKGKKLLPEKGKPLP